MSPLTETRQAASSPEILRSMPAQQIEPVTETETAVKQLGRIVSNESHLSFHAHSQPQTRLALVIASGAAQSSTTCKRAASPHRSRNKRQART